LFEEGSPKIDLVCSKGFGHGDLVLLEDWKEKGEDTEEEESLY